MWFFVNLHADRADAAWGARSLISTQQTGSGRARHSARRVALVDACRPSRGRGARQAPARAGFVCRRTSDRMRADRARRWSFWRAAWALAPSSSLGRSLRAAVVRLMITAQASLPRGPGRGFLAAAWSRRAARVSR